MKDVIKIVKLLEEFILLIKSASAAIENGVKKQNGGFNNWHVIRYIRC